jgi:iron complex transport system substrate-binding protein
MNMCTDLLLLQLVPRERIAAVTYLARDGARSLFPGRADGISVNYGTAEDLLKFKPDLILADRFSTPVTRRLARRIGAPIVEVDGATRFADIRATLRLLGMATGEAARAESLIAGMDAKLAGLAARPQTRRRVVAWSASAVPGKGTLTNAIIEAAGAVNIAAAPGPAYATFDAEQVVLARPDVLLLGGARQASLRSEEGQQNLTRRLYDGRRVVYDETAYTCGLPQSADAAVALRRALDAIPGQAEPAR